VPRLTDVISQSKHIIIKPPQVRQEIKEEKMEIENGQLKIEIEGYLAVKRMKKIPAIKQEGFDDQDLYDYIP
jgi:hypothetical protein